MTRIVLEGRCLQPGCDEVPAESEDVELWARRHTGEGKLKGGPQPGHPTAVEGRPERSRL